MVDMNASALMVMKWQMMKISVLTSTNATIQPSVLIQTRLARTQSAASLATVTRDTSTALVFVLTSTNANCPVLLIAWEVDVFSNVPVVTTCASPMQLAATSKEVTTVSAPMASRATD
jgi:hypothetical protein